jgi:PIN domain nuclease of toxin-antitoxin system
MGGIGLKLLLDIHIWLWYLLGNPQLSQDLKTIIPDRSTELWLSPISLWETLMLAERGRINLQPTSAQWIDLAFSTLPMR